MKKITILIVLIMIIISPLSLAHKGRTDSNGGHYDYSTGEYHYHHGYEAHQHPNGVCPYDYEDKTGQYSFTDTSSDNEQDKESLANEITNNVSLYDEWKKESEELKNQIIEKDKKIESLNNEISNMWIGFIFIFLIGIYISYNIVKYKKD